MLKSVITLNVDDYFAISKLLFSYSFNVPRIALSNVYFFIVGSMFLFLFNRSKPKASVVNQISHLFFKAQKYFFFSSQLFENGQSYSQRC